LHHVRTPGKALPICPHVHPFAALAAIGPLQEQQFTQQDGAVRSAHRGQLILDPRLATVLPRLLHPIADGRQAPQLLQGQGGVDRVVDHGCSPLAEGCSADESPPGPKRHHDFIIFLPPPPRSSARRAGFPSSVAPPWAPSSPVPSRFPGGTCL